MRKTKRSFACEIAPIAVGPSSASAFALSGTDIATERCPWQDNSYTIGPLTPVLSYWGQLLSTHLRAHWIETDYLLQGQLVSCSRWLPASPQGSDHIFSLLRASPAYGL